MSDKMELVSFKLCPFVQRAVIVLKHKQVDFKITYIDLSNPPEWFLAISPLGKVPVLKVGKEVLFESAVIQEYVDEVTPPSLNPDDPLIKAKNRAWSLFGEELNILSYKMVHAQSKEAFKGFQDELLAKLQQIESVHSGQSFFNGETFNLIDAAYAPFFMRLELLSKATNLDFLSELPKMQQWSDKLLAMPSVKSSVVKELPQMYLAMIKNVNQGYLASICR